MQLYASDDTLILNKFSLKYADQGTSLRVHALSAIPLCVPSYPTFPFLLSPLFLQMEKAFLLSFFLFIVIQLYRLYIQSA